LNFDPQASLEMKKIQMLELKEFRLQA
jgi:hypothetical protein